MRLLLVEDARLVREPLVHVLRRTGWEVDTAEDGERALALALSVPYDAIVLDIMLPHRDGLSVLAEVRRAKLEAPVILLTARDDVRDRVRGLDLGADDYLSKPFHASELLARLRAVMRRHGGAAPAQMVEAWGLAYDPAGRKLAYGGRSVELTGKEGLILECLMRRAGHVVARAAIEGAAWGHVPGSSGRLETQISSQRMRLRELGAPMRVRPVRGVGYVLERVLEESGETAAEETTKGAADA